MQLTKGGRGCGKEPLYLVSGDDISRILYRGVREGRKIGANTNTAKIADFVLNDAPRLMTEIKKKLSTRAIARNLRATDRVEAIR